MPDKIETIQNAVLHHGNSNERAYLLSTDTKDISKTIKDIETLAKTNSYSKILLKLPTSYLSEINKDKYIIEATVPCFYKGSETAIFLSYFSDPKRNSLEDEALIKKVLSAAEDKKDLKNDVDHDSSITIKVAQESDADKIAEIYKKVFKTYPFPIDSADYILRTMKTHVIYFLAYFDSELAAVSSSEISYAQENAEMTDFATLPAFRGKNLSHHLLVQMETKMRELNMKTLYTIARAQSYGMNITFSRNSYLYAGTLKQNTNICGHMESMNVWYKHL